MRTKGLLVPSMATIFASLSISAIAWACTATVVMDASSNRGAPGSPIDVRVNGLPAEIRWNSSEGPLLATARPTATITIPGDASPGVYYIVAVQRDPSGAAIGKISETFEVIGSAANGATPGTSSADLWSAFSNSTSLTDAGIQSPATTSNAPGLGFGLALLGVGLAGLAGSAAIVVGRKRAHAKASR